MHRLLVDAGHCVRVAVVVVASILNVSTHSRVSWVGGSCCARVLVTTEAMCTGPLFTRNSLTHSGFPAVAGLSGGRGVAVRTL